MLLLRFKSSLLTWGCLWITLEAFTLNAGLEQEILFIYLHQIQSRESLFGMIEHDIPGLGPERLSVMLWQLVVPLGKVVSKVSTEILPVQQNSLLRSHGRGDFSLS